MASKVLMQLAVVGAIGLAGFLAYDYFYNAQCKRILPFFNLTDPSCLGGSGGGAGGPGFGQRAGLIMDPLKVGEWLRSIQGSADTQFYKSKGRLMERAQGRPVGSRPVRVLSNPPVDLTLKGPLGGRISLPKTGQAPIIKAQGGARIGLGAGSKIALKPKITLPQINPTAKYRYIRPGRPVAPKGPIEFNDIVRGITEALSPKGSPRTIPEYLEWIKSGFKDPGARVWESLGGEVRAGKPVIGTSGKIILKR